MTMACRTFLSFLVTSGVSLAAAHLGEDVDATSTAGNRTVLIVRVCYKTVCPDYASEQYIRQIMWPYVDNLFRSSSYGSVGFPKTNSLVTSTVIQKDVPTHCSAEQLRDDVLSKFANTPSSPNPTHFTHAVFYIPDSIPCVWSGYGWKGSSFAFVRVESRTTLAHELGHNLGLPHSSTDGDDDGVQNSEYNDDSCIMGAGEGAFSAPQRILAGWISTQAQTVLPACSGSSAHKLNALHVSPAAAACGSSVLRLPRAAGGEYYLSYRASEPLLDDLHKFRVAVHYKTDGMNPQLVAVLDTSTICHPQGYEPITECVASTSWTGAVPGGSATVTVDAIESAFAKLRVDIQTSASCQASSLVGTSSTCQDAPSFGVYPWKVVEGPCSIDESGCAMSGNFPQGYGSDESCKILINHNVVGPIKVKSFDTTILMDAMVVDSQAYFGHSGPDGVTPMRPVIFWKASSGFGKQGWKMCMDAVAPSSSLQWSTSTSAAPAISTTPNIIATSTHASTSSTTATLASTTTEDATTSVAIVTTTTTALAASTTTTISVPAHGTAWVVVKGPCAIDADSCAMSPNYPNAYGHDEECTIRVVDQSMAAPINVAAFNTEKYYDDLTVNGVAYSGLHGPEGVTPNGDISWQSDFSEAKKGWKICMGSITSTAMASTSTTTTLTPMSTTTTTSMASTTTMTTITIASVVPTTGIATTTTASAPPTTTVGAGKAWIVVKGPCTIDSSSCASSANYPSAYGHDEECIIRVLDQSLAAPISVEAFSTEKYYDKLSVNGVFYSGKDGPAGVTPHGDITWRSDHSESDAGWRICMSSAPPVTTTGLPTTSTSSSTAMLATTTTTTTTVVFVEGLSPEDAALYNPTLGSYWDHHHCGKASNNHHWSWCWNEAFECQQQVQVEQSLCASGKAGLAFSHALVQIDGCTFAYYAQYVCETQGGYVAGGGPNERRLTEIILV